MVENERHPVMYTAHQPCVAETLHSHAPAQNLGVVVVFTINELLELVY